jgi:predicted nucleotidyltransferase
MKASPTAVLSEYRARLEEIYGERLMRLVLFGSQAREDAEFDSDIDVSIVLSGPLDDWTETQHTTEATSEISLKYDTVISRVITTPEQFESSGMPFYRNVRREGVLV